MGECARNVRSSSSRLFHLVQLFIIRLKMFEGNEMSAHKKLNKKNKLFKHILS